jgi:3-methylcrotonyl-CoA carboxylase alpha subunit
MFKKILIANRGEIAVRIMATCREMGIQTVAVYSDADHHARHVREANEAYPIGPAPATQSYLNIDTLIEVAQRSGAEAIHPGYGFLSENATFVEACEQAGIVFIGPPASAMRLMGSKIAAKRLAHEVGAPIVPGYNGDLQDDTALLAEAERIGFPLLIKASAGGGGKGMREVQSLTEFPENLASARREALAAFGDQTVFLEKLIQQPRHIEIQILGDSYGNIIYLGERECSIQRRHQKIVEESPSTVLTPALRATMGETAVRIARAARYVNAGTLEFMLDGDRHFYFLEMNTRLQVEHPVTELVTGLDLVRLQISIAAGEPLHLTQEQVHLRGHAIEVRLYAEDAAHNFLPSTGTITHFATPQGPGIRLDSGIENGDEITQYYDPMIAKLIVTGENRLTAIQRLQTALRQTVLFGVTTTLPLLLAISEHPAFQAGDTHTGFLTENYLLQFPEPETLPEDVVFAAALSDLQNEMHVNRTRACPHPQVEVGPVPTHRSHNLWKTLGPWRMIGEARAYTYLYHETSYTAKLRPAPHAENTWQFQLHEQPYTDITCSFGPGPLILLKREHAQKRLNVQTNQAFTEVIYKGQLYRLQRQQPLSVEQTAHASKPEQTQKTLIAPMAGTLIKVQAQEGDTVEAHQVLMILSAMKMEHAIIAPYAGTVQRIHYQEGAVVPGGAILIDMA